jgi:hypothetical protein
MMKTRRVSHKASTTATQTNTIFAMLCGERLVVSSVQGGQRFERQILASAATIVAP